MKRGLTVFLLSLLILVSLTFATEPISLARTVTQTTAVTTRHRRHKRSFWKKHRDKLTVAGSALAGAGIGGLAGGGKGAAIGSLVGGGSGALYTYKIRKRHRHYRRY
jgi:hypothetical protein